MIFINALNNMKGIGKDDSNDDLYNLNVKVKF